MTGADVLEALVRLEREANEREGRDAGPVPAGAIARELNRRDGRAVTAPLKRLEHAGLAERVRLVDPLWRPTARGRELDGELAAATTTRGGRFRPRRQFVPELAERLSLR